MAVQSLVEVVALGPRQRVDLLALHRLNRDRYPFLCASVAQHPQTGRYDILFAFPQQSLTAYADGGVARNGQTRRGGGFLQELKRWWHEERELDSPPVTLPFRGGWFVFIGYELAGEIEPRLNLPRPRPDDLPIASATRIPAAVIVDHATGETFLVAERPYAGLIEQIRADIEQTAVSRPTALDLPAFDFDEDSPADYLDAVSIVKNYIEAGDVFQVNLSRQWRACAEQPFDAVDAFAQLCQANPGPFAALAKLGPHYIASSSPERLVYARDGWVETRPIAGTRPRGAGAEDDILIQTLRSHPKERAEHVMLIDLERNDLGRICVPGTVEVNELMTVESYRHVHHIVSNVRGRLRQDVDPAAIIAAVFPGGTITGCPKVRCMEIIAELERVPRGAYTGSLGYINRNGDLDLNILIRTMHIHDRDVTLRAGAGVVADSIPKMELKETRHKARGLLMALGGEGNV